MGQGRLVALLLLVVLVASCTSDGGEVLEPTASPSPTPASAAPPITGPRVAVVLPASETDAPPPAGGDVQAIDRLRTTYVEELSALRAVTPDDPDFTSDIVVVLAEQGYDLVCVVGTSALDVVAPIAPDYPRTRFCVYPAAGTEAPDNVLVLDLAVEEAAFVAATVAVRLAPGNPPSFVGSRQEYGMERRRTAFQAAVREATADDEEPVSPLVGVPADDAERAASFARTHFGAGATVIYTEAGSADAAVRAVAEELDGGVIGSAATLFAAEDAATEGTPPPAVILGFEERLDAVLRVAIDRLLGEWSAEPIAVGFVGGAYALTPGGHPLADRAEEIAEELRLGLETGDLAPSGGS